MAHRSPNLRPRKGGDLLVVCAFSLTGLVATAAFIALGYPTAPPVIETAECGPRQTDDLLPTGRVNGARLAMDTTQTGEECGASTGLTASHPATGR